MYFGDEDNVKEFKRIAGNTGNSYITYSLINIIYGKFNRNFVTGIDNIYSYNFDKYQEKDLEYINNECTHAIFILQDQIRREDKNSIRLPFEKLNPFLQSIKVPIVVMSIGANSFTPYESDFHTYLETDLIKFLYILSEKSNLVGLRGEYTESIFEKLGIHNTLIIGCPSFFKNGRNKVITKKEYNSNFKIASTPSYAFKYPFNPNIEVFLQDEFTHDKCPYACHIFSDMEQWENKLKEFDFFVGTRLHGSIVALNAGIPALCMNGDMRAKSVCKYLKIPLNVGIINESDINKVYEVCDFTEMNRNYNNLRERFLYYLRMNGVPHV